MASTPVVRKIRSALCRAGLTSIDWHFAVGVRKRRTRQRSTANLKPFGVQQYVQL